MKIYVVLSGTRVVEVQAYNRGDYVGKLGEGEELYMGRDFSLFSRLYPGMHIGTNLRTLERIPLESEKILL